MLQVINLYFRHSGEKEDLLRDVNIQAREGEVTVLLGPNGAGKSTLYKCISGLWRDYRGEVRVQDKPVDALSAEKRSKFFSVVPQGQDLSFPYTVREVVVMGRAQYVGVFSTPNREDYDKAEEILELLGIQHLQHKVYLKISGGERQLTLLARALVQEAPVLILDEPTTHLDFKNQISIMRHIKRITLERKLVTLMTLHDPNLASFFADKVFALKRGTILWAGIPNEVLTETNLSELYEIDIKVINHNNLRIIIPGEVK
ncbi:MAG: ABC transporter ATP-binding protein [Caldimicrobium sp.]|nr:ABC transporter ATP-binding protein [Caldimicrobium sp.]MCX7613558.1 ABC transporter ATP-binding protein [Caldimicrobium sp.]MDW8182260.1 ABC transporter ATP-binding protein [Caldimicrobium sp.]